MKKTLTILFALISAVSFSQGIISRCPVCPPSLNGVSSGYVLTDSSGNAVWQPIPTGDSSNLWSTSSGNLYPTDNAMLVGIGTTTPQGILDVTSGSSRFLIDAGNNYIQAAVRGGDDVISLYGDGAYSGHYFHVTVGDAGYIHMTQNLFGLYSANMQIGNLGGNGTGSVSVDNNGLLGYLPTSWSTNGNAGTTFGDNFIGTTDGESLLINGYSIAAKGNFYAVDSNLNPWLTVTGNSREVFIGDNSGIGNGTQIQVTDNYNSIIISAAYLSPQIDTVTNLGTDPFRFKNIHSLRGDFDGTVKIADGTEGVGKIYTSDSGGYGSWETVSTILSSLPEYATNAAAITGGLEVGDAYYNTTLNVFTKVQ